MFSLRCQKVHGSPSVTDCIVIFPIQTNSIVSVNGGTQTELHNVCTPSVNVKFAISILFENVAELKDLRTTLTNQN